MAQFTCNDSDFGYILFINNGSTVKGFVADGNLGQMHLIAGCVV